MSSTNSGIHAKAFSLITVGAKPRPRLLRGGVCIGKGSLTITYFHTGNPHYHWRGVVSRSCSGWEGVGPTRYGHQA